MDKNKKWIKKAEITKILNTYAITKGEFEQVSNINYCYQSKLVKGYMIKLSEEQNDVEKTGRIIVTHTQSNGKKTYVDVWERNQNNELQFCFRNLWNQPLSDQEHIKSLEYQVEILRQAWKDMQAQLVEKQKLIDERTPVPDNAKYIRELEREAVEARSACRELKEENQKLINDIAEKTKHNARNAGRRPSKERLEAIEKTKELLESGASNQDIMKELGISRATLFRYKKSISNSINK